jgi:hypothetical protein
MSIKSFKFVGRLVKDKINMQIVLFSKTLTNFKDCSGARIINFYSSPSLVARKISVNVRKVFKRTPRLRRF